MANEQNLRPGEHKFTQEEHKRGGIASGEARRKRKHGRELLRFILEQPETDKDLIRECVEKMGLPEEYLDNEMVMHARQIQKAKRKADTAAYREVMRAAGYSEEDGKDQNISITISPEAAKAGSKWSSKK